MSFLETLQKRRVVRTTFAYAVVAWGAVQVVLTVGPELGLPDWSGRLVIWLALAGLPVVLGLSWAFDLSDRGVRLWRLGLVTIVLGLGALLGAAAVLRRGGPSPEEVETVLAAVRDSIEAGSFLSAHELLMDLDFDPDGDDPAAALNRRATELVTIRSDPPGARVLAAAWRPGDADPDDNLRLLGLTPLEGVRLPRTLHYLRFELDGFYSAERPLDLVDWLVGDDVPTRAIELSAKLRPAGGDHPDMVAVPGGEYSMASPDLPRGIAAVVDDYLLDRYEVTNEEYTEFVRAGGYDDPRYWIPPFVDAGDTVSFEEAMSRLTDRTGLRAPRGWVGQEYPTGMDRHPVTGVSWYEAAAYAEFRGKQLPTAFQWEKAARSGRHAFRSVLMPWGGSDALDSSLANFGLQGTIPVDARPYGISPFGAHVMAGNALEWLENPTAGGRAVTGGSWDGPFYTYSEFSGFEPFFASPRLGFRLAYLESGRQRLSADQGARRLDFSIVPPSYEPVSRAEATTLLEYYDYDPVDLDPVQVERTDEGPWIRERVTIASPYADRIPAFLYLPKVALPPYQTLVYVPSGGALFGATVPEDVEGVMGPVVRSGRAVLAVALSGMTGHERPADWSPPETSTVRFRDELVQNAVEMRVGIDYLETRSDIDSDKIGYAAFSFGAGSRGSLLASDPRFSLAVLHGAGIDERVRPVRPEVDPVNFAPYYELPILIVQGRHDEEHPYETRFLPLYELLPAEYVTLEMFDGGGHLVPLEDRVPVVLRFLDEHWGPVAR